MSTPTPVLFVAGAARSGSTALALYLESALDVVHVGELRYVWTRGLREGQLCECGQPFTECPFWHEVLQRAYPDGVEAARAVIAGAFGEVDRMRHIPTNIAVSRGRAPAPLLQAYGEVLAPLYRAVLEVSGADLVLDSTKEPSYLFALNTVPGVDLRVVHLVRDSRAVAYSWTRSKVRPEIHWRTEEMLVRTPADSARRWLEDNAAVELFGLAGRRPARLRYEEFAADPEASVAGLRSSLRLPARRSQEAVGHSFSGNPIRFSKGPLRIAVDQAWVAEMPARQRRTVTALTAPLMLRYGYRPW